MSFASRIASSSAAKRWIPATGPNVSSRVIAIEPSTPVSTVGSKNVPSRRRPPRTSSAPEPVASATWRSTFSTAPSSISGPTCVPSSSPLPTTSLPTAASKRETNSSWIESWTRIRFAETQVWPELRNLHMIAPSTAASRSASSKTRNGALPPSSSETFFTVPAHCAISSFPISVEPVKESLRTVGFEVSSPPITGASSASPVTIWSTPSGTPASAARSASASAVSGVCSAGLTTIVQPAASAGAALRVIIAAGKFQGVIPAVTPIGSFRTTIRLSGWCAGIVSP